MRHEKGHQEIQCDPVCFIVLLIEIKVYSRVLMHEMKDNDVGNAVQFVIKQIHTYLEWDVRM